jgi:RNA polymerase sigma factor (sigma-70 family)
MNHITLAMSILALMQATESSAFMSPPVSHLTTSRRTEIFSLEGSYSGRPTRKAKLAKISSKKTSAASRAMMLARAQKRQPIRSDHTLHRLTHEEEMTLLREMRAYPAESSLSQAARQTLLLHNLPLVQSLVSKAMKSHPRMVGHGNESQIGAALSMDDLLNEGTIGLAEALDKYDFEYSELKKEDGAYPQGARLGSYATYWIRARITRAIQSREHAFRFPERTLQASHRLVKAARVLELDWNTVVDLQIADTPEKERLRSSLFGAAAISSESQFCEAIRVRNMSSSTTTTQLESWMSSRSSSANLEVNEQPDSGCQHIHDTLSKFLGPREVQVLSLRYGLACPDEECDIAGTARKTTGFYRDYQAEAEEDLFGPGGILSHYSDVPVGANVLVSSEVTAPKKEIARKPTQATTIRAIDKLPTTLPTLTKSHKINLSTTQALLPFKEVGKKMKVSGEYCRRICAVALEKLSLAAEEGRLAESDFLLGW